MQEAFYGLLAEAKQRGRTVFMSSHVLSEVERVCDRIGLIRTGELVLVKPVDELRRLAPRNVHVVFSSDVQVEPIHLLPEVQPLAITPREWTIAAAGPIGPLVQAIASLPVADLRVDEPHLEDVLVRYYREETT
jgi:ABC-2 type transport system ATP-binding protein